MKQKTAMMELIEALETDRDYTLSSESVLDRAYASGLNIAINEAKQLLEKEKEQIEVAYDNGYIDDESGNASIYYIQTYLEESKQ